MIEERIAGTSVAVSTDAAGASFYLDQRWCDLIADVYGYSMVPLVTRDAAGRVTGRLPLCLMSSPLTGRRLVSLPFSDHVPLVSADDESTRALVDQALDLAREIRVRYLELRTGTNATLAADSRLTPSDLYVRWMAPLAADPASAWARVKKPVQVQIKKARKLGVVVRQATERADMRTYYRLHVRTRGKKHGMPAQPERYFLALWDTFAESGNVRLFLAEHDGQPIAGIVVLAAGDTARYAYGASDERFLHLAPNNLLMWEAMAWACGAGYQLYDFGRTACDNAGLMQFKRGWGTREESLTYYYAPRVAGLASTSEESRAYRLLTSTWRKLPQAVAGPLGGALYKHLG